MIDPGLIVFGIRALIRLMHTGKAAYEQYERDRDLLFPEPLSPDYNDLAFLRRVFDNNDANAALVDKARHGALSPYWSTEHNGPDPTVPGAAEALYLEAVRIRTEAAARQGQIAPRRATEAAGALLVQQWAEGQAPVGPLGQMVLALADIGLEFVGTRASVLGIGGNGEKLLGAIASNLADMIPDDGAQFGNKTQFAEWLIGLFLHAGLQAINDQPALLVSAPHLQALIARTLPPIIQALPNDLAQQSAWRDVTEVLLGPAAQAAIDTVAAQPTAFLGDSFDPHTAMGALTQALLHEASQRGLRAQFSEAGFLTLYRAALDVAASRPELFVGRADRQVLEVATGLIGGIAAQLHDAPPPLSADLGTALAGVVLETLQQHSTGLLNAAQPWEQLATILVAQVIEGLKPALEHEPTRPLFSHAQLLALARTLFLPVAQTPAMLTGDNRELQGLVQSVARAITQAPQVLLSPEDWCQIGAAAAREVVANPQRLLTLVPGAAGAPAVTACTALITDLLAVASGELTAGGRQAGGVLSGATLRDAIILVLRAASGHIDAAMQHRPALQRLTERISQLVRSQPGQYGSREWLMLFQALLDRALTTGESDLLTAELAARILARGTVS
jgi:hypothetical protein